MIDFFKVVVYEPLYNILIALIDILPGHNVGLAVIAITIMVRLALYPSSKKAIKSQVKVQEIQGDLQSINKKYKDNREERAKKTMALYKEKGINPLSPIIPLFLQIPIILSLYYIFAKSGLPIVNPELLYSFIPSPDFVTTNFLSLFDVTEKSLPIALLAGLTQFIHAFVYRRFTEKNLKKDDTSFQASFQKSMNVQMQYIFPVVVVWFAYSLSAAIAIYWTTSNLFSIIQERLIRGSMKPKDNQ